MLALDSVLSYGTLIIIAVHILAQKGDLLDTLISKVFDFVHNTSHRPITLSTSHKRHDTETTHVITSAHNTDPRIKVLLVHPHRHDISIGLILTQLHIHSLLRRLFTVQKTDQSG
jgi:hypothetical protein